MTEAISPAMASAPLWMALNPYAVSLVIAANSLAIAIAVLFSARGYPQPISRSLMLFGGGKLFVVGGFLLFALRTELSPLLSIVCGNALLITGFCANLAAVRAMQRKSPPLRLSIAMTVLAVLGSLWFGVLAPDLRGVRIIISLLALFLCGVLAFELLFRFRNPGRAHYLGGVMALVLAAGLAARIYGALNGGAQSVHGLVADGVEQVFFFLVYIAATISAINFTMISNDTFNEELRQMAASDPLTGLANRRRLLERGEEETRRAHRYHRPLTVLVLDLDHFKRINDNWGHAVGDGALKRTADCCLSVLRDIDIVGRLGGEEFVAILPETDLESGQGAAERLRAAIAGLEVDDHPPLRLTVSIGVATLEMEESFAAALDRADAAMYRAKQAGRNCVRGEDDDRRAA